MATSPTFSSLFLEHIAPSYDKQTHLQEQLGDGHRFHYELASGLITFDEQLSLATQILGTESYEQRTWLWAWANEQSAIPLDLLQAAGQIRQIGEQYAIPVLTAGQLHLDQRINGYRLATVACGLTKSSGFYRAEYPGGAIYLLIRDEKLSYEVTEPGVRIARLFPRLISQVEISNQRAAFLAYLRFYSLAIEEEVVVVQAYTACGLLCGKFDSRNNLVDLMLDSGSKHTGHVPQ